MFVFITSIRHPLNCVSYETIGSLLDQTLRSICRQTNPSYKVLVLYNQMPDVSISDSRIEYLQLDYPLQSRIRGPETDIDACRVDKGAKYAAGLIYSMKYQPNHIMFFDADDFLSRNIVDYVSSQGAHHGWYLSHGYIYDAHTGKLRLSDRFYRECGTCYVWSTDLLLPYMAGCRTWQCFDEIVKTVDPHFLRYILGSHIFAKDFFEEKGTPLTPIPFPAAIKNTNTGENHSGFDSVSAKQYISRGIASEFGVDVTRAWLVRCAALNRLRPYSRFVPRSVRRLLLQAM